MIRLTHAAVAGLGDREPTVANVRKSLQLAIELEHSTIPPYLYALFSLTPGTNDEVSKIIRSVVVEEMLHMVLAANVLNAIGGKPAISKANFTPRYPGPLPGGVEGQLEVQLRPFSKDQLATFIEIEEPRETLDDQPLADQVGACTIGEFYTTISSALERVGSHSFTGFAHHQVGPDLMFGSVQVTDIESAKCAIETIIEQGEGTGTSPMEIDGPGGSNDYAHYYRFMEVWEGRRLIPDPGSPHGFSYTGEVVTVDPQSVAPLPVNPRSHHYGEGSDRHRRNIEVNATYTHILASLHKLTNGHADMDTFMASLGLMRTFEQQARELVATSVAAGEPAGPTFEYHAAALTRL